MTSKRERQKANRAERLAREAKEAKRQRQLQLLRRGAIIAALVIGGGVLYTVFFGGDDEVPATTTTTTAAESAATTVPTETTDPVATSVPATTPPTPIGNDGFRAQPTACGAEQPPPPVEMSFDEPADQELSADAAITATLATSCGNVVIALDQAASPETVNSFVFLSGQGYYDGTASHRIVPGFVVQAGDPTATGTGGPGYVISDEFPDEGFVYERGLVAMANAGAGSTGSQFFIVTADAPLPAGFNVLGRVVEGMDVVDLMTQVPLTFNRQGEQSVPLESVYLDRVTVDVS